MTSPTWSIGIATGCHPDTPILDVLPLVEVAGFHGVEISTPPNHFDFFSTDAVDALAAGLRANRLNAISMHAPFGRTHELAALDRTARNAAVAGVIAAAEALERLGGRMLVVHVSDLERHGRPVEEHLARGAESVATIGARCRALGVTVAVESPLPHLIGGHPTEFASLVNRLDRDVAVCLDTGHVTLGHHWPEFVEAAGSRLAHVHVSDHHGHFDDHLPPGDGVLNWAMIRRSLSDRHFTGWLMLELASSHRPAEPFLIRSLEQAHRLLAH